MASVQFIDTELFFSKLLDFYNLALDIFLVCEICKPGSYPYSYSCIFLNLWGTLIVHFPRTLSPLFVPGPSFGATSPPDLRRTLESYRTAMAMQCYRGKGAHRVDCRQGCSQTCARSA